MVILEQDTTFTFRGESLSNIEDLSLSLTTGRIVFYWRWKSPNTTLIVIP